MPSAPEIRRLIYTTNIIEAYNRQLRKVTKNRGALPSPEAIRKLLWLAHQDIIKKWTMPVANWANILNQLAIRFEHRFRIRRPSHLHKILDRFSTR